jgi:hypothetical protein
LNGLTIEAGSATSAGAADTVETGRIMPTVVAAQAATTASDLGNAISLPLSL